jgi:hypothetical protein
MTFCVMMSLSMSGKKEKCESKSNENKKVLQNTALLLTKISPYFLWLSTDHQTQMTDDMLQLLCMQLNNYLGQQCCSMIWSLDLSNGCSH